MHRAAPVRGATAGRSTLSPLSTPVFGRAAMRRCVLGLGLSLSLSLSVDGQLIGGAGSMGGDACSMATFTARTDEVDGVCCNAANSAADRCVAGVPQRCDSACATVFIPWYTECEEIITTIVDEQMPIFEDVLEMCQAGDTDTLFNQIHDVTLANECRVHLPHTPIAPGCFDVGCSIPGGSIDTIDGVESAAACQELCAQHPECYFFVFRTDGHVAASTGQSLQSLGGSDGQCRFKGIHSQATMVTEDEGFPGVCGPQTCNEVVEETFHWDSSTGFLGWQVLGPGVTSYAASNTGNIDTTSHTYRSYDCVGNCDEGGAEVNAWGNGKIWGLIPWPWETRDHANDLLYVRSPPFSNPVRIEFDLMGGSGTVRRHPANENQVPAGYLGVCVRSVRDGSYLSCVNIDCGTAANGWTDGTVTCDTRAAEGGWASTGIHNWNHMVIDCGPFVTNTVEQYTLEIVDNYGAGPWAHLELQDVVITAALADETPNLFYSRSLTALQPMVTIDSASGNRCTATGALCEVSGNIRPSQGPEPAPFGLPGYTFMQGDDVHLNAPTGVMIDGTWTVDCFIQTPFPCTNCESHVASGWHTLVRGQNEDHPVLLWSQDESTLGAYDNSDRRNVDGSSAEFYPTTFKMSELADGWHRLTVTGAEDITSYYIDGEKVGEVYFVATTDIYQVGNAPSLTQPWGDLAGFMLFDEALSAGQVKALYHGACVAGDVCGPRQPGCTAGQKQLACQEDAEQTSGLAIGDLVEHHWDSMLVDFCHSEPTVGAYGAVTNVDRPDPMLARGTVCGFDGSLVLVHWDMVQNTQPSCPAEQVHTWCESDGTWCRNGMPFWTRLRDGAPRDSGWLASYLGDAADTAHGGSTTLCGISPTRAELKSALPPFTLEKITCSNYGGNVAAGGGHDVMDGDCVTDPTWRPPILGGRPNTGNQPGGGHRRQMGSDDTMEKLNIEAEPAEELASASSATAATPVSPPEPARVAEEPAAAQSVENDQESSGLFYSAFRALQAMGVDPSTAGKAAHKAHVGLQDFDSDVCSIDTIGDLAEAVEADCCYQNGVYKCSATSPVPETCSYACGAVMVPFYDNCGELLTNLFANQMTPLTRLYDSCLNADARVLTTAYDQRECCTPENCNGCQSADTCSALPGNTCQWGPSASIGRQIDSRCNCVGGGPGPYGSVAQENNAYPDYASCHAACLATEGCHFFGVWDASPSDNAYPDYCRMWDKCETCEHAVHSNTVWQAHAEYELTPPGLTWSQAQQFCQSHGGHLVRVSLSLCVSLSLSDTLILRRNRCRFTAKRTRSTSGRSRAATAYGSA